MARRRRGRFSLKENRRLMTMISAGASVDEAAATFRTSRETILQKTAEFGVRLEQPPAKPGKASSKGQLLVIVWKNNHGIAVS